MSAGLFPAGIQPAGADPIQTGYSTKPKRPTAMRYEGATRDWALDELDNYKAVTPTEQAVVLSICVRQGDIKSSPKTGSTLQEIVYLGGEDLGADIRDRVLTSNPLARLIADGQAEVTDIRHEETPSGFKVAVYFKDLTADKSRILRADASVSR
ncbi:MAG: hypothetical protein H0U64_05340 [Gemmatimonadaceae bacterium]|nr:hypothetical protein [Gemmatimonadaceae bacterium]